MEKNLYRVRVILYVMAENESEARLAATRAHFDIFECTAKKATHIEPGWDDAVPYNSEDARTCAKILSGLPKVVHISPRLERWQPEVYGNARPAAIQVSPG